MKKSTIFPLLAALACTVIMIACGGDAPSDDSSNNVDNELKADSTSSEQSETEITSDNSKALNEKKDIKVPTAEDVNLNELVHKFGMAPTMEDPFVIDSLYLAKTHKNIKNNLTGAEVSILSGNYTKHASGAYCDWIINETIKIDSIKQVGGYEEYVESLDLGNTKDAYAYALGKVALPRGQELLLWAADYKSYEACPSFSGTTIFGSVLEKGIDICFRVGELSYAADPPVGGETNHYSNIYQDGKIDMSIVEIEEGEDDEGNGEKITTTTKYTMKWADGKLKEVKKSGPNSVTDTF